MVVDIVINILAVVFVLGVLITVHEAGHFLMARLLRVTVEVFSVGFGKRLWGFRRGDTDYRVSLIPLGGYVRIPGLGPDESTVVGTDTAPPELLPRWKRAAILVAGPVTNVVFAVVFMAVAFTLGVEVPAYQDDPPRVGWVQPGSPAEEAKFVVGDLILAVDGVKMETWRDLDMSIYTSGGHEVQVELERGQQRLTLPLVPQKISRYAIGDSGLYPVIEPVVTGFDGGSPADRAGLEVGDRIEAVNGTEVTSFFDLFPLISPHAGEEVTLTVRRDELTLPVKVTPTKDGLLKLHLPSKLKKLPPLAAVAVGAHECVRMTRETFRILGKLITRKTSARQISGPIDIARIAGAAARSGFHRLIWLMGLISLQLGIFNLLPIPILDGGHLTIIGFETAIRRDLSLKLKERILEVGFYLLMVLIVVVLFNDIVKVLPQGIYDFFTGGE